MNETLVRAVRDGDADAIDSILAMHPDQAAARLDEARSPSGIGGMTAFHLAVHWVRPGVLRVLARRGVPINARNAEGRTALHDAIEDSRDDLVDLLIELGAKVDVCAAAILGRLDRLREILNETPEAVDDRTTGLSPLGWAAYGNRHDTATELILRGAKMDDGELLCAASVGHVRVGRVLLDHGADPDAISPAAGGNALHAAVSMRNTCDSSAFVALLLSRGADPTIRSAAGKTAIELAEEGRARQQAARERGEQPEFPRDYDAVLHLLRGATDPVR